MFGYFETHGLKFSSAHDQPPSPLPQRICGQRASIWKIDRVKAPFGNLSNREIHYNPDIRLNFQGFWRSAGNYEICRLKISVGN